MVEVQNTLQCTPRTISGKSGAHKLRAAGLVPVVAYGPGSEPRHLALEPKLFNLQRRAFGTSYIYDVAVAGSESFKALIKSVQVDPMTQDILHVDLYAVDMTRPIRVDVPIELEGKPAGAIEGGLLAQLLRRIEVQCLPDRVPAKITIDVSPLALGDVLHTSDLKLPEGVSLTSRRDEAIAACVAPEAEAAAATTAAEGEVAGATPAAAGEAAAAAAPAEEKKKDDKKKEDKKK